MASNFSGLERSFAKLLSKFPFIKKKLKLIYVSFSYLISPKKETYTNCKNLSEICIEGYESFFGYYDKYPMNSKGIVLCHLSDAKTKNIPNPNLEIKVIAYDTKKNKVIIGAQTRAYNWQQGSRLHWLNDDLFIFNDYCSIKMRYISRVFSLRDKKEIKRFDFPVQDSFNTQFFLSLNYRRLASLRPDYGYFNLPILTEFELQSFENDGIWQIDYHRDKSILLYSLQEIINFEKKEIFNRSRHCINHIMIAPDGLNCIFIHRFFLGEQRFDRLFKASLIHHELKILADNSMVSHCNWINNNEIIGYLRGLNNLDSYYKIQINTNEIRQIHSAQLLKLGDGHPSIMNGLIFTDSYPNKARMQSLISYNIQNDDLTLIGAFFHSLAYRGVSRCDLHPRISNNNKTIFFDSVFSGKRKLYKLEL